MTFKLIVIVSLAAIASSTIEAPVAFHYNVGYGYAPPVVFSVPVFNVLPATVVPYAALKAEDSSDPAIIYTYDVHNLFLQSQNVKPPYHYSYGYEAYDWKTGVTRSHYESRYGDVAVGNCIVRASDGSRSIVDYTVDTPNGFYALLRKDFQGRAVNFGYARLAGPLAYASHTAPDEYAPPRKTILADPGASENPMIKSAYRTHRLSVDYLNLTAPFNVHWGYELKESQTGERRSQYETYFGELGEGRYTHVEADGTGISIDYSISPVGFAVTSPQTFT